MDKTRLVGLAVLISAVIGLGYYMLARRQQDCQFSGWTRTIGVDLEVAVKDLDAVKTKLGLGDSQVRDFDALMKDYALKYDGSCQDVRSGRISTSEYACIRTSMDKTLDAMRQFVQAVEAAKSLSDVTAQRDLVQKSLDNLHAESQTNYRSRCSSAIAVDPRTVSFAKMTAAGWVEIGNHGNRDVTFSIDALPDCFVAKPTAGSVVRGASTPVLIIRTLLPVPEKRPLTFHIRTNFQDDEEIEIKLDPANEALFKTLGDQARADPAGPTVETAVRLVSSSGAGDSRIAESDRYFLASELLFHVNANEEATKALNKAAATAPPDTWALVLRGLIANRANDTAGALTYLAEAKRVAAPKDAGSKAVADLFAGTVMLKQGDNAGANTLLIDPNVQKKIEQNPELPAFTAREVCSGRAPCRTDDLKTRIQTPKRIGFAGSAQIGRATVPVAKNAAGLARLVVPCAHERS